MFTPNGDGTNDLFKFKHQSLKECRVTISDRWGRVVYREKIDDIYEWKGWNGVDHNTKREAPEGQYYYVVEGLGYDNVEHGANTYFEQLRNNRQGGGDPGSGGTGNGEETQQQSLYVGWLYLFR